MQTFILMGLGAIVGSVLTIVLIALLSANKQGDIEHEKLLCYKEGYEKGFAEGCEHKTQRKGG